MIIFTPEVKRSRFTVLQFMLFALQPFTSAKPTGYPNSFTESHTFIGTSDNITPGSSTKETTENTTFDMKHFTASSQTATDTWLETSPERHKVPVTFDGMESTSHQSEMAPVDDLSSLLSDDTELARIMTSFFGKQSTDYSKDRTPTTSSTLKGVFRILSTKDKPYNATTDKSFDDSTSDPTETNVSQADFSGTKQSSNFRSLSFPSSAIVTETLYTLPTSMRPLSESSTYNTLVSKQQSGDEASPVLPADREIGIISTLPPNHDTFQDASLDFSTMQKLNDEVSTLSLSSDRNADAISNVPISQSPFSDRSQVEGTPQGTSYTPQSWSGRGLGTISTLSAPVHDTEVNEVIFSDNDASSQHISLTVGVASKTLQPEVTASETQHLTKLTDVADNTLGYQTTSSSNAFYVRFEAASTPTEWDAQTSVPIESMQTYTRTDGPMSPMIPKETKSVPLEASVSDGTPNAFSSAFTTNSFSRNQVPKRISGVGALEESNPLSSANLVPSLTAVPSTIVLEESNSFSGDISQTTVPNVVSTTNVHPSLAPGHSMSLSGDHQMTTFLSGGLIPIKAHLFSSTKDTPYTTTADKSFGDSTNDPIESNVSQADYNGSKLSSNIRSSLFPSSDRVTETLYTLSTYMHSLLDSSTDYTLVSKQETPGKSNRPPAYQSTMSILGDTSTSALFSSSESPERMNVRITAFGSGESSPAYTHSRTASEKSNSPFGDQSTKKVFTAASTLAYFPFTNALEKSNFFRGGQSLTKISRSMSKYESSSETLDSLSTRVSTEFFTRIHLPSSATLEKLNSYQSTTSKVSSETAPYHISSPILSEKSNSDPGYQSTANGKITTSNDPISIGLDKSDLILDDQLTNDMVSTPIYLPSSLTSKRSIYLSSSIAPQRSHFFLGDESLTKTSSFKTGSTQLSSLSTSKTTGSFLSDILTAKVSSGATPNSYLLSSPAFEKSNLPFEHQSTNEVLSDESTPTYLPASTMSKFQTNTLWGDESMSKNLSSSLSKFQTTNSNGNSASSDTPLLPISDKSNSIFGKPQTSSVSNVVVTPSSTASHSIRQIAKFLRGGQQPLTKVFTQPSTSSAMETSDFFPGDLSTTSTPIDVSTNADLTGESKPTYLFSPTVSEKYHSGPFGQSTGKVSRHASTIVYYLSSSSPDRSDSFSENQSKNRVRSETSTPAIISKRLDSFSEDESPTNDPLVSATMPPFHSSSSEISYSHSGLRAIIPSETSTSLSRSATSASEKPNSRLEQQSTSTDSSGDLIIKRLLSTTVFEKLNSLSGHQSPAMHSDNSFTSNNIPLSPGMSDSFLGYQSTSKTLHDKLASGSVSTSSYPSSSDDFQESNLNSEGASTIKISSEISMPTHSDFTSSSDQFSVFTEESPAMTIFNVFSTTKYLPSSIASDKSDFSSGQDSTKEMLYTMPISTPPFPPTVVGKLNSPPADQTTLFLEKSDAYTESSNILSTHPVFTSSITSEQSASIPDHHSTPITISPSSDIMSTKSGIFFEAPSSLPSSGAFDKSNSFSGDHSTSDMVTSTSLSSSTALKTSDSLLTDKLTIKVTNFASTTETHRPSFTASKKSSSLSKDQPATISVSVGSTSKVSSSTVSRETKSIKKPATVGLTVKITLTNMSPPTSIQNTFSKTSTWPPSTAPNTVLPVTSTTFPSTTWYLSKFAPEALTTTNTIAAQSMQPQYIADATFSSTKQPEQEPPTKPSTLDATIKPPTTQVTLKPSTSQPTTNSSTAQLTTRPSTSLPTTQASTSLPTTHASTSQPTTKASKSQPNTHTATSQITTKASTSQPSTQTSITSQLTTKASTSQPTTKQSPSQRSTQPSTSQLTTKLSTSQPTTKLSTSQPSTKQSASQPTTQPSTSQSTSIPSTSQPTTKPSTLQPTTQPPTSPSTPQTSMSQPTTNPSTSQPFTNLSTPKTTTECTSPKLKSENTTTKPTSSKTTINPTTPKTTTKRTTPKTTTKRTTPKTTTKRTTPKTTTTPTTPKRTTNPTTPKTTTNPTTPKITTNPTTPKTTTNPTTPKTITNLTTPQTTTNPTTPKTTTNPTTPKTTINPTTPKTTTNPTTPKITTKRTTPKTTTNLTTSTTTINPTTPKTTTNPTTSKTTTNPTTPMTTTKPTTPKTSTNPTTPKITTNPTTPKTTTNPTTPKTTTNPTTPKTTTNPTTPKTTTNRTTPKTTTNPTTPQTTTNPTTPKTTTKRTTPKTTTNPTTPQTTTNPTTPKTTTKRTTPQTTTNPTTPKKTTKRTTPKTTTKRTTPKTTTNPTTPQTTTNPTTPKTTTKRTTPQTTTNPTTPKKTTKRTTPKTTTKRTTPKKTTNPTTPKTTINPTTLKTTTNLTTPKTTTNHTTQKTTTKRTTSKTTIEIKTPKTTTNLTTLKTTAKRTTPKATTNPTLPSTPINPTTPNTTTNPTTPKTTSKRTTPKTTTNPSTPKTTTKRITPKTTTNPTTPKITTNPTTPKTTTNPSTPKTTIKRTTPKTTTNPSTPKTTIKRTTPKTTTKRTTPKTTTKRTTPKTTTKRTTPKTTTKPTIPKTTINPTTPKTTTNPSTPKTTTKRTTPKTTTNPSTPKTTTKRTTPKTTTKPTIPKTTINPTIPKTTTNPSTPKTTTKRTTPKTTTKRTIPKTTTKGTTPKTTTKGTTPKTTTKRTTPKTTTKPTIPKTTINPTTPKTTTNPSTPKTTIKRTTPKKTTKRTTPKTTTKRTTPKTTTKRTTPKTTTKPTIPKTAINPTTPKTTTKRTTPKKTTKRTTPKTTTKRTTPKTTTKRTTPKTTTKRTMPKTTTKGTTPKTTTKRTTPKTTTKRTIPKTTTKGTTPKTTTKPKSPIMTPTPSSVLTSTSPPLPKKASDSLDPDFGSEDDNDLTPAFSLDDDNATSSDELNRDLGLDPSANLDLDLGSSKNNTFGLDDSLYSKYPLCYNVSCDFENCLEEEIQNGTASTCIKDSHYPCVITVASVFPNNYTVTATCAMEACDMPYHRENGGHNVKEKWCCATHKCNMEGLDGQTALAPSTLVCLMAVVVTVVFSWSSPLLDGIS